MSRISKWLDVSFIQEFDGQFLDIRVLPEEVQYASEVYMVTIFDASSENSNIPASDRWTKSWTIKDGEGHQVVDVYTSFEMALADYWRRCKEHPDVIMRVERRNLDSIISGKMWIVKLVSSYGDSCYVCDGKKACPNDYWKRWPNIYPEEAEKKAGVKRKIGFVGPETVLESASEMADGYEE